MEVHYECSKKNSKTTKKPLPAWFLQGGSDQLWESRIPDPPEGYEDEEISSLDPIPLIPEDYSSEDYRIPITTPTGPSTISTTTTKSTSTSTENSIKTTSTHLYVSKQMLVQNPTSGQTYYDLPQNIAHTDVQVKIVDIPIET